MTSTYIELKGFDELLRKVDSIEKLEGFKAAFLAGGEQVKSKVAKYPPSTEANSPDNPTGRWYQRGYGPRWKRRDGSIGGRKTSEALGRRWTTQARDNGLSVAVGNNTSYGPYAQDIEKQARFHKERGWKTIQDVGEWSRKGDKPNRIPK